MERGGGDMKYFLLEDNPELKYAPKIQNWYGAFDVRNINMESYPKLPKRQMFTVEASEHTMFTDIILFPFLLVSAKVQEVLTMYREPCFFRDVVLLDQLKGEAHVYYLPVFKEAVDLAFEKKQYRNGVCISKLPSPALKEGAVNLNMFWVRKSDKRYIVLSLALAESLIRRNVTGLGLTEVVLYGKE